MSRQLRALVVDDNDDDIEILLRALRMSGLDVVAVRTSTRDGVRAGLGKPVDLVISDWSLPGLDALEVFQIVRDADRDVPFIIVSGTIDEEIAVTALRAGVHDFIGKNKLARLAPAIEREVREANVRRRKREADEEVERQRKLNARNEDRYRVMFESSPMPMWTYDPDTLQFVAVNDAAIRHYGYSRDEFLTMRLTDIRPTEDVAALRVEVRERIGFAGQQIWRHRKRDGSIIHVEITSNDLVTDGRRLRLILVNDVTDRERPMRRPLGMWIAFGVLVLVAVLMSASTYRLVHTMNRIDHTHRMIEGLDAINAHLDALTAARRAFAVTADAEHLDVIAEERQALTSAFESVHSELENDVNPDDVTQHDLLAGLERAMTGRLASLDAAVAARRTSDFDLQREVTSVREAVPAIAEMHRDVRTMINEEHARLVAERDDTTRQAMYEWLALVAGAIAAIVTLWLAFTRLGRETRLRRAAQERSKRSEESLATTLQSIGDGVIATDRSGNIQNMNAVAERLTGWRMSDAIGRPFGDVFITVHEGTRASLPDPVECVLREGKVAELDPHTLLVARDGTETAIADSAAPIRDVDGILLGVVLVFRDATLERAASEALERRVAARTSELVAANEQLQAESAAREKATEALRKTEDQLRQSQKIEAIGRLAGGIAHDFNNVLSVILSYSEMLLTDLPPGLLPDEMVTDIGEIHKAGLRATELTRQLLAFSRQQVLAPRVLDLNGIITGMDKLLLRVIGADIELRTLTASTPMMVKVDPGQMEQVIMNLVVNARDAMPRGGKLTIETSMVELDETTIGNRADATPGRYIMMAVTDSGIGMSKDVLARIFEPFFTTKEKGKGTGLGLSTVFGIVQQSGGIVWPYSEPGEGTTFKIYLPETREVAEAEHAREKRETPRGSETVLLVEDEPQVRAVARGILTKAGYVVLEATDGIDALELCKRFSGKIQLVVTDVVMPRMSGREMVENLAKVRPDTKVLFMSGYTDDTVVHHGVLAEGIAFLQKPITPDALTQKVREILG